MERRNPHNSTKDLLTWSDAPQPARSTRPHQPSDQIRDVVFGGQQSQTINKRLPCSGDKMNEMSGSGIFEYGGENDKSEPGSANPVSNNKTGIRMYQQSLSEMCHVSFAEEEGTSSKKPTNLPEVTKQHELNGILESEDAQLKKQLSNTESKELGGHIDISATAPPPQIFPRPTAVRALALKDNFDMGEPHTRNPAGCGMRSDEAVAKTAKKNNNQKLREMSGSNIFADGKAESRDYLGGVHKPPGGESSIDLV